MADIEDRLKSHTNAFDGLLSLIPGNKYYEGDTSSQWNKRKQSKEERKRAKKAKLDPDAATSAAEVRQKQLEEKRSKATGGEEDGVEAESSKGNEGKKQTPKKEKKKQQQQQKKLGQQPEQPNGEPVHANGGDRPQINGEKELPPKGKGKRKERPSEGKEIKQQPPKKQKSLLVAQKIHESDHSEDVDAEVDESIQFNDLSQPSDNLPAVPTAVSSDLTESANKPEKKKPDPVTRAEQRARLEERIKALRASRKADTTDGTPARNRQELMEARRKQAADRKEKKKQIRMQTKAEQLAKGEAERNSERSGSIIASTDDGPVSRPTDNDFSFGMVTFGDGEKIDPTLARFQKAKKRKGPTDLLGQLKHIEAKNRRIENMPQEKQEEIKEKEKWKKALKHAQGEKVKDDEKLLKKSLKREGQKKKKSEREWNERIEGVAKGKAMRQEKRERNIQARIDQKKAGKMGRKVKTPGKKGSRPGFEGSMKSGKGSSKKGRK